MSPDHRKVRTGDALDGMSFFVEMVEIVKAKVALFHCLGLIFREIQRDIK